jgi:AAA domain
MTTERRRVAPAAAADSEDDLRAKLDRLTLARKEGFRRMAEAPARPQPEALTRTQLKALGDEALAQYNRARRGHHANLGPLQTPQMAALHEDMWDIIDSNHEQEGDKAKGAIGIDAFPGLGKTTAVLALARKFHCQEIQENGRFTDNGDERWPVCRVGLTSNAGTRDFNRAILEFYGHAGRFRGTAADFGIRALDSVLTAETKILIIDDVHFLRLRHKNGKENKTGVEVRNHFKWIANEFPITLIMVGVGLAAMGLFDEGDSYENADLAQMGRRTTPLAMEPFMINTDEGRENWRNTLLAIEKKIVLADKYRGMVADDLSEYLFARSTGHIGSLMTLINRGCQRAVRTGAEKLDAELLDKVKNDAASEKGRKELELAFQTGKITTRLRKSPK